MKLKGDTTDKLIKMSETVRDEITRDIFDTFGIDLSDKELAHHDKTKPVWTQQICDNRSLRHELDSFLNLVKNNVERLPEMMQFEKEHPGTIEGCSSHDSISYDLEFLWICESHVNKFESENYVTEKEIVKYKTTIQQLRDKIRDITVGQSLQNP